MSELDRSDVIEEVRARTDIVAVIQEYVNLQRSGESYRGICPFHSERTPSFNVSPKRRIFHCFGCQETGNVFDFLMKVEGIGFREALERLAAAVGVTLPGHIPGEDNEATKFREAAYRVHDLATKFYHKALVSQTLDGANLAREYLVGRGITSHDVTEFRLGYAPDSWEALTSYLVSKGCEPEFLSAIGLSSKSQNGDKYFDRFRNRVIFPICDERGKVVAFGGRVMDGSQPKYLNSSETAIFVKGRHLYGLFQARDVIKAESVAVLVEGYMDVIACHKAGLRNAVASLGTALATGQARTLGRFAKKVVICYDSDSAGTTAAIKAYKELASIGLQVLVASLGKAKDPDELVATAGIDALRAAVESAVHPIHWQLNRLRTEYDFSSSSGRVAIVDQLVPILSISPNAVERAEYIRFVSDALQIPVGAIEEEVNKVVGQSNSHNHGSQPTDMPLGQRNTKRYAQSLINTGKTGQVGPPPAVNGAERELIALMIDNADIIGVIKNSLGLDAFRNDSHREIAQAIFLDIDASGSKSIDVERILSKLTDSRARELLGRLATRSRPDIDTDRIYLDCVNKIREYQLVEEKARIHERMLILASEGRNDEVAECLRQMQAIDHRLVKEFKGPRN